MGYFLCVVNFLCLSDMYFIRAMECEMVCFYYYRLVVDDEYKVKFIILFNRWCRFFRK